MFSFLNHCKVGLTIVCAEYVVIYFVRTTISCRLHFRLVDIHNSIHTPTERFLNAFAPSLYSYIYDKLKIKSRGWEKKPAIFYFVIYFQYNVAVDKGIYYIICVTIVVVSLARISAIAWKSHIVSTYIERKRTFLLCVRFSIFKNSGVPTNTQ